MLGLGPFGANGELEFGRCLIVHRCELAAPITGNVWSRRRGLFLRGGGAGRSVLLAAQKLAEEGAVGAVAGAIAAAMARTSTTVQRNALVMICSSRSLPRGRKMRGTGAALFGDKHGDNSVR